MFLDLIHIVQVGVLDVLDLIHIANQGVLDVSRFNTHFLKKGMRHIGCFSI